MKTMTSAGISVGLLVAALALAVPNGASAGGYGYGGYYRSCGHYDRLQSDYQRLRRDYDATRRHLVQQVQTCQNSIQRQQSSYQNLINQQRGLNAELINQTSETSALMGQIAEGNGIPEDLLNRPTREEYDDLEERYQRLMRAYRNLERDHRELTQR